MALQSGLNLMEDEVLVAEIEAELWAVSSNQFAQMVASVTKFIYKLLGFRKVGFLVITNKRVVEIYNQINCYCINTGRTVKYLLPQSIKEVGYMKLATCGLFCPGFFLYYEGLTQKTSIILKDTDDAKAQKLVDSFYRAIASR